MSVKTKDMRAEEQLKLAYMTMADLKNQNAKLVEAMAVLERRIAESDGRDRRMVEEFYRGMIEDMREAQEREIASLRASQEKELESLRCVIRDLTGQISALAASGKVNAGKLYGRESEKSARLGRRTPAPGLGMTEMHQARREGLGIPSKLFRRSSLGHIPAVG